MGEAPATAERRSASLLFPELAYFETHPDHPAVQRAARQWGKGTMLCCWMAHLTPWRPEWFASVCHPDHWPARCPLAHCQVPGCRGNGVRRSADGQQYSLVIPHHKTSDNSSVRDRPPITYPFPPTMFPWVEVWSRWCWPLIAAEVRVVAVTRTRVRGASPCAALRPRCRAVQLGAPGRGWTGMDRSACRRADKEPLPSHLQACRAQSPSSARLPMACRSRRSRSTTPSRCAAAPVARVAGRA